MMKFKPNQTRTYDCEGFKKRAACLCFKNELEEEVRLTRFTYTPAPLYGRNTIICQNVNNIINVSIGRLTGVH